MLNFVPKRVRSQQSKPRSRLTGQLTAHNITEEGRYRNLSLLSFALRLFVIDSSLSTCPRQKQTSPGNIHNFDIPEGDCFCLGHLLSDQSMNSAYAKKKNNRDKFHKSVPSFFCAHMVSYSK